MPIYPKVLKIPETEIIGCRRVVVILSPKEKLSIKKAGHRLLWRALDWHLPTEARWGCSLLATEALKLLHTNRVSQDYPSLLAISAT